MIWEYQKYVGDTEFYEVFDSKKNLARARSEYSTTYAKKHDFWVFTTMWDSARAARDGARAPNFFWKSNLHDKISLQIFLFGHNLKSEFFRAIWSLKFFFENSIFSKNFANLKILKIFKFFLDFSWKNSIFKGIYSNQFKRYNNFENS